MTPNRRASDRASPYPHASLADLMHDSPRRVPVTLFLLGANILVFVLLLTQGAGLGHTGTGVQLAWGANFGPATQDGQWWRLFTAMFLHFGIVHLGLNMWALWDVGRLVERLYGRWRFTLLYVASGIFGNLLSLVVQGNQAVSGGASGAIFSLYGALLVYLWRERRTVHAREFRWFFGAALVFTLVTLVVGQLVPGIDNAAHAGGLAAGALLARSMAKPFAGRSVRAQLGQWTTLAMLGAAVAVLVVRVPPPRYRMGEELRARQVIREFITEDQRITSNLDNILKAGQFYGLSVEEIAGRIDASVTREYQASFEQLSGLQLDPHAPSSEWLDTLRKYAELRTDSSQALSEALRTRDPAKQREALELERRARTLAFGAKAPASAASGQRGRQ